MSLYVETFVRCLNKYGEELCGDCVEIARTADSVIVVLADGLGSGVKANILATLTTKIASSMLKQGAEVDEVVSTLAATLPVCQVRQLAYSTFLILQIFLQQREAYLVEFDCPETMLWRQGRISAVPKSVRVIEGRKLQEARFPVQENDTLFLISDGVINAGVGGILNLGWQWHNVAHYLEKVMQHETDMPKVVSLLSDVCDNLYMRKPGDDTTVVGVKIRPVQHVTLFTGPPADPARDEEVVARLLAGPGLKIVCGGTTAQIVSRETQRPLLTSLTYANAAVPPTATIPGIDLVTEGVLTLSKALELIRFAKAKDASYRDIAELNRQDGASRLARILLCECTHLQVLVGQAINPAHQNPGLPLSLALKLKVVDDICQELKELGKEVSIAYY
ncbi:MAG: SpoIIE family protein phosphatase [Firmicutes bacterium]|nr:SpoIIE family protein phosphatase [Bacillota bacterium]